MPPSGPGVARLRRLSKSGRKRSRTPYRLHGLVAAVGLLGLVAGAATVAGQEAAEEAVTGPVAIRSYQLLTPYELAGSGIDPEVEVKVEIDAAGAVANVDILGIEPTSEFDDLLRSHVESRVGGWRYGPARDANGNPTNTTLSWRMKFESPRDGRRSSAAGGRFNPQFDVLIAAGRLPRSATLLTAAQRGRALSRTVEVAEKHIAREHRRRRETPRFILISDSDIESTIDILAGNMESVFQIFHSLFDPDVEPLPENFKTVVYLYRKQESYNRLHGELGGTGFGTGFYRSPGFIAFHQEVEDSDRLLKSMLHEAFHAFSDSHLTAPRKELPRWAEEGLAEYFGNSKIQKGRLIPGKTSQGKYVVSHGGPVRRLRSSASWSLAEARSALRRGEAPTVAELLEATRETFYGERHQLYYGFSWLLTHFLRHGRETWDTGQPFATMLLYVVEGYSGQDALAAAYGTAPGELQTEFERYVRKF